jgi:PPP family 3-phenylpropionic acid transporter
VRRAPAAYVLIFVAVAAASPYMAIYYQSIGISLSQIGALGAFGSVVGLTCLPIWGSIHDRYPRSYVLLPLAGGIAAVGACGIATVGASPLLIGSVACFACGSSGLTAPLDTRVLDLTGSDRSRFGWVRVFGSATFMVGAPVIGFIISGHNPVAIFLFIIPAYLLGGLAATTVPGRKNVVRLPSLMRAPGRVLGYRPIAIFLLADLVFWVAISAQAGYFSIYLKSIGATDSQVGWAWSIGSLLEVPTLILFPFLARRFGVERLILAGAAITSVRQITNVLFPVPAVVLGISLVGGLGYALLVVGGVTYVSRQSPKGTAATAQGILGATTGGLSSIIGSGGGGFILGWVSLRALYTIGACLGVAGTILIAMTVLPAARRAATADLPDADLFEPVSRADSTV